ncbi:MAG TPA: flagellar export protein FliJ [Steroidobacteraceae bacterium]|nr:flagellar export protein FliJ [Steroidobacteraceae bacterium]
MATKRSQRMAVVQKVVDDQERRRAQALAASERRVQESEAKLTELEKYRAGYLRDFSSKAGSGISAASARDYQVFLARLEEALKQQAQIVARAKDQRDTERRNWQGAAQRAGAVDHMVQVWNTADRKELERHEQKESDEFSQRSPAHGVHRRGS